MRKVQVKELTLENFQNFGTFSSMINPNAIKIGEEPVEFFRDMEQLNLGNTAIASFSVCRVLPRPPVVDVTEMHRVCGEGTLPLDGDVVIHVGPPTPNGIVPLDQIEAFRVPKGTFVCIKRGVWHHAPIACGQDPVNTLIVLPERTYADDCYVYEIPVEERITVTGI